MGGGSPTAFKPDQSAIHPCISQPTHPSNRRINPITSQVVLSCTQDDFFAQHRNANFGDLGVAVKGLSSVHSHVFICVCIYVCIHVCVCLPTLSLNSPPITPPHTQPFISPHTPTATLLHIW